MNMIVVYPNFPIWQSRVSQCEIGAKTFVKRFYDSIDENNRLKRIHMSAFYHDSAQINYRGHVLPDISNLSNLYESLPESEHRVESFDCQPIGGEEGNLVVDDKNPLSFMLMVCGTVGFLDGGTDYDGRVKRKVFKFVTSFILVAIKPPNQTEAKWKIVSEVVRLYDQ